VTPERWREVRAAFDSLAPLSPAERDTALSVLAERDAELARETRSLLAAEARDAQFLTTPAGGAADRRGELIGPWELLSRLGEGGMGQVFLARRADASFDKLVAVKFVHSELLSPLLRERFAAERQALAALEHPGIARLLDGGESATGEPYLVLEYVEGQSLLAFATSRGLARRERIALFLQVLAAVAHAHRHLVVHRDIKPANILVNAAGEAKLLDFGVAKILNPIGDSAGATRTFLRALTPEYASPEQVLGGVTTTATDVYSLGVVLFELLTGRRPYRVATGAPEEWGEAAIHQEVAPAPELKGDLDAIVGKALRKPPSERYATVDAFADDLRRHLEGRPVAARRGNLVYRAAKFAGRHRGALTAAALALVVLATTLVVAGNRLRRERDRATLEAATAQSVAEFLAALFQNADPARTRGAKLTAREILDQGAQRIELDLADQPLVQARLLMVLGAVYRDLGLLDRAQPLLDRALDTSERQAPPDELAVAAVLTELGLLDRMQGETERARPRLERALEIRERRLGADHLDVGRTLSTLGTVCRLSGDAAQARTVLERAVEIVLRHAPESSEAGKWQSNLGLIYQDAGELEAARQAYARATGILERAEGPESPFVAMTLDNLGSVLRTLGRPAEALPLLERARGIVEQTWGAAHPQFGNALNSLGDALSDLGRNAEAVPLFRQATAVYSAALGPDHSFVAWPLRNEAEALLALGRAPEALPLFERALAIRQEAFGAAHPETAQSLTDLGLGYAALGDLGAAEKWLREGLKQSRATLEPPSVGLAEAQIFLADLLVRRQRTEEARALYAEALPILRAAYPAGDPRILVVEKQLAGPLPVASPHP
jgi:tetratricopeptide (TPR) repeat protein/tRNA A-37 threonylcarbamoyl transferase component Bud32